MQDMKEKQQEKDKIIAQCRSELDEQESLADDGKALVVVSNVCLQSSMEHAGIPDTKRGEISTFHGLQSILR
jgi:hypothetical protein